MTTNTQLAYQDPEEPLLLETKLNLLSSNIPELNSKAEKLLSELSKEKLSLPWSIAEILISRGVDSPSLAKEFLAPSLKENLPNPFLMLGVKDAAKVLKEGIVSEAGPKKITVFTDFDVDGISSGAQLVLFLHEAGANVSSYTPNRFTEGYGLSESVVKKIALNKTDILVTVDCGISNKKELALARKLGMKTVVIDHHQIVELPDVDAIVNPCQEGCPFADYSLAAAGLVWMFLVVLRKELEGSEEYQKFKKENLDSKELPRAKDFLDLAALGTICDMVPLIGPNRLIALRGLEALAKSERPGLKSLIEVSGVKAKNSFSSGQVSFMLGPRINAAGRVGEGKDVIELLTTKSKLEANSLANKIDLLNKKRKKLEKEGLDSSLKQVDEFTSERGIIVFDQSFHLGVIGIIAQRLVQKYHKPAIVMAPASEEEKDLIKGSVRSIKAFNVSENLKKLSDYLLSFGGHEAAGGFSLKSENLPGFKAAFLKLTGEILSPEDLIPTVTADIELKLSSVDFKLVDSLNKLEPFGAANPAPVFYSKNVMVDSVRPLAAEHLKLQLSSEGRKLPAVAWKFAGNRLMQKGNSLNIAYVPEINLWKGISNLQLNIKEVWPA